MLFLNYRVVPVDRRTCAWIWPHCWSGWGDLQWWWSCRTCSSSKGMDCAWFSDLDGTERCLQSYSQDLHRNWETRWRAFQDWETWSQEDWDQWVLSTQSCAGVKEEYLKKSDDHKDQGVWSKATLVRIIQLGVEDELLESHYEVFERFVGLQIPLDQVHALDSVVLAILYSYVDFLRSITRSAHRLHYGDSCPWNILYFGKNRRMVLN